jgi:hypothetical protein
LPQIVDIRTILQIISFLPPKEGGKLFNKIIATPNLNLRNISAVFLKSVVRSLRPTPIILSSPTQKRRWIQSMDSAHTYISEKLQTFDEAKECLGEWQIVSINIFIFVVTYNDQQ